MFLGILYYPLMSLLQMKIIKYIIIPTIAKHAGIQNGAKTHTQDQSIKFVSFRTMNINNSVSSVPRTSF